MTGLRLLADDLTGALDTAAELVGVTGPVHAFWHGAIPSELPANAAVDSGTRELDAAAAVAVVARLAPVLAGAELAYKKVDTLLRGPTLAEVAACARAGWEHAVFAPAFPFQGRATRGGVQYARNAEGRWSAVGGDIVAALGAFGVRAQSGRPDAPLPPGVNVFDAEADTDLARSPHWAAARQVRCYGSARADSHRRWRRARRGRRLRPCRRRFWACSVPTRR